ncbi:Meiosis-specific transcription factor NDT80 [Nakaseomyces bracarensis]|uniref:Meiosis-specific transcription factor NDT80 n=1 Tax=Nakaseomyces bracarensis TaxID=273131 RepID=A0ABR4NQK3_9SACH
MVGRQRACKATDTYEGRKNKPTIEEVEDPEYVIKARINEDGTISNYFDKRKLRIAPRSTLQFKVGPPFKSCGKLRDVICNETGEVLNLRMRQRIDRGFDHIGEEWVGYKRNYFTLVSAFEVNGWNYEELLKYSFSTTLLPFGSYEIDDIEVHLKVLYFAIKIKATDDNSNEIQLIQHTAKRDKGPQFTPDICPLIPAKLPNHQVIREASNVRNVNKKKKFDPIFHFYKDQHKTSYGIDSLFTSYPDNCIKKVARFERVQFSASNSVERHFDQNRFFKLHVIMGVVVAEHEIKQFLRHANNRIEINLNDSSDELILPCGTSGRFMHIEKMETPALIIRGRSPSNYTPIDYLPPKSIVFDEVSLDEIKEDSLIDGDTQLKKNNGLKMKKTLLDGNTQNTKVKPLPRPCRKGRQRPANRKSKVIECKINHHRNYMNYKPENDLSLDNDPNYTDNSLVEFDERALEALLQYNTSVKSNKAIKKENKIKPNVSVNRSTSNTRSHISILDYGSERDDKIDNVLFDIPPRVKIRKELLGPNFKDTNESTKRNLKKNKTIELINNENLPAINLRDLEVRPTNKSVTDPGVKIGPLVLSSIPNYNITEPQLIDDRIVDISEISIKSYGKLYDSDLSMIQNESFIEHKVSQTLTQNDRFDYLIDQSNVFDLEEDDENSSTSLNYHGLSRMATINMQTNSYQLKEVKMANMINNNESICHFPPTSKSSTLTTAGDIYSDGIF